MLGRLIAVAFLVAGTLIATMGWTGTARAQNDDETKTDASIRVVHASPGSPNVDVLVDGQAAVKDLAFGAATEYFSLPDGDHKIQVTPTDRGPTPP